MTVVIDGETLAQLLLRRGLEARGARTRVDPDIYGGAMTETGARLRGNEKRFGEFVAGKSLDDEISSGALYLEDRAERVWHDDHSRHDRQPERTRCRARPRRDVRM
jgi:hypothetical protein